MTAIPVERFTKRVVTRVLVAVLVAFMSLPAVAAPGGSKGGGGGKGGGGPKGGGGGKSAPAAHQPTRTSVGGGSGHNTVNNNNVNVNVNKNTNVNTNVHGGGGYYGPPGGYYGPPRYGPSPAAVVVGAVATAVVVGAVVASLPPSCTDIIANGVLYHNCGGNYYQPQYVGGNVTYVVVAHP
jgi:hypothetical protein